MRWLWLAIVVPIIDLALLVYVGWYVGGWIVLASLLAAVGLGAYLAKAQGLSVWRQYREALTQGTPPDVGLMDGLLILLGGLLLVFPGWITDLIGLLLMIGPVRRRVADRMRARLTQHIDQNVFRVVSVGVPTDFQPDMRPDFHPPSEVDESPWFDPMSPSERSVEVIDTEGVVVQTDRLLPPPEEPSSSQDKRSDK